MYTMNSLFAAQIMHIYGSTVCSRTCACVLIRVPVYVRVPATRRRRGGGAADVPDPDCARILPTAQLAPSAWTRCRPDGQDYHPARDGKAAEH